MASSVPSSSLSEEEEDERFMKEVENAIRSPLSIFKLPESVRSANPDAFLPRLIALGPSNANNKMEFYKLYKIAKKARRDLHLPDFDQLCSQLRPLKFKILACYDTHIEIDADNLARIMVVHALFLLRLLLNISTHMGNSASNFGNKMLLNDVLKLENQIPLVVFQGILSYSSIKFPDLLYHFAQFVSPFDFGIFRATIDEYNRSDISPTLEQSHHLLHFIYLWILICPHMYRNECNECYFQGRLSHDHSQLLTFFQDWFTRFEYVSDLIQKFMELRGIQIFYHETTSSPVIPSASQLHQLPINFKSTVDGILDTKFAKTGGRFTLPIIIVNDFTETLLENLLAFEAMANINKPVYAHYVQLMKALIRSTKDVQILKQNGIIKSHVYNDEQVVKLFQRLGSSISNLNTPTFRNLQPKTFSFGINNFEKEYKGMVLEINQYYDSFWKVKVRKFWKMLLGCIRNMLAILFKLFQILVVVQELVNSFIANDEPNYDHIPPT